MKFLIVEDSLSVRQIIRSLLEGLAGEIDECGDGGDAVSFYRSARPDFVLMDVDLEEMDGITASRKILEFDPQAKIIIVTNYDRADMRAEAMNAGACGYVLKENLLDVINVIQAT